MDDSIERRAAVHAALGDPWRLAIVDELAVSDRSPSELAARLGLSHTLLAHHLLVLERAELIERLASEGDRRRRYVRLLADPDPVALPRVGPAEEALFVCTRNSARSQLAAALWRRLIGATASSAGTHPVDEIHPGAVAAAERAGLELTGATPRALRPGERAPIVVTVCDQAHEQIEPSDHWWHWSVPDPVAIGTPTAFDIALSEIEERILDLTPGTFPDPAGGNG